MYSLLPEFYKRVVQQEPVNKEITEALTSLRSRVRDRKLGLRASAIVSVSVCSVCKFLRQSIFTNLSMNILQFEEIPVPYFKLPAIDNFKMEKPRNITYKLR